MRTRPSLLPSEAGALPRPQRQHATSRAVTSGAGHHGRPGGYAVAGERVDERAFLVSLAGEHDLQSAPLIAEQLRAALDSGAPAIVVDLAETTSSTRP